MPINNELKETRWRQRFQNLKNAYSQFEDALKEDTEHKPLMRSALIQNFEFTFELAWKTLKDRLEAGGIVAKLPRDTIQESFQAGFIKNGSAWIDMLQTRNELSHVYDEVFCVKAEKNIRTIYAKVLKEFFESFKQAI